MPISQAQIDALVAVIQPMLDAAFQAGVASVGGGVFTQAQVDAMIAAAVLADKQAIAGQVDAVVDAEKAALHTVIGA